MWRHNEVGGSQNPPDMDIVSKAKDQVASVVVSN